MRFAICLRLTVCSCLAAPAGAAATRPAAERESLQAFAEANAGCQEWSDGCAVCVRRRDGHFGCSLPGIACQPRQLACQDPNVDRGPDPAK